MAICLIPARGGSKRIPRKNIKEFCGKPMIAWSIETAIRSNCFERVIVTTDDAEIGAVAKEYGAEVPFSRPDEISDDHVGILEVVQHAIGSLDADSSVFSSLCLLYATAPLVQMEDLQTGKKLLDGAEYALSVTNFTSPIQRALRVSVSNYIEMINPENYNVRSQDLEETWHDAGQFCWGTCSAWKAGLIPHGARTVPVRIPAFRVQDIDTIDDWRRAEMIFQSLHPSKTPGLAEPADEPPTW